jgi:hypothetical protein
MIKYKRVNDMTGQCSPQIFSSKKNYASRIKYKEVNSMTVEYLPHALHIISNK